MRPLAAVLLLVLGMAHAADPGKELFEALDLNGDGFVSLSEAAGNEVVVTRFDRGDKDRDGKLSPKEFANLKNVKVRVAKAKAKKEDEGSAATGGSAKAAPKDKTRAASGG
jgi:Ca2+-binding EF-hand superfamily protein